MMRFYFTPILVMTLFLLNTTVFAQSKIKDGTINGSSVLSNADAVLEIESANKGLLLPRVALTALDAATPLSAHVEGMTVYNTATNGAGSNAVSPGYYYNDGEKWVRLVPAYKEPWNVSGSSTPADSNQQNIYQMGKVAIGTDGIPTASLDINGNLRVRDVPVSNTTKDIVLVADAEGYVKARLNDRLGSMAGYITADFTAGSSGSGIYKLTQIKDIFDPGNDFDSATALFTAPLTGTYRVGITVAASSISTTPTTYVYGFANASDDKWVVRFSVPDSYVEDASGSTGSSSSFTGIVKLVAGQRYYFGVSYYTKVLASPSGSTGTGLGTYFEIKLVDK